MDAELKDKLLKAEIVDPSYPISGASSWFPHGYFLADKILSLAADELEKIGYGEIGLPSFVSIEDFRKQAQHIKSFLDRVYMARPSGSDRPQVIKSTIEAQISPIFAGWFNQRERLPFRVYTRRSVGRYETGKTTPLWKERLVWPFFEAHCATYTDVDLEIDNLDKATKSFCRSICLPILKVERLKTNRRLQEYSKRRIEAITIMPSGLITVLTSIYDLGENFSRVFDVGNKDEGYLDMINFAFSGRLILAMLGYHFRGEIPIYPPKIAPFQVAIIPIRGNDPSLLKAAQNVYDKLSRAGQRNILLTGNKSFRKRCSRANMLGAPLRLFIGYEEIAVNVVKVCSQFDGSEEAVSTQELYTNVKNKLSDTEQKLWRSNLSLHNSHIVLAETKEETIEAIAAGQTVITWLCSDPNCISPLEESNGEIIGRLDPETEKDAKCIICRKAATQTILYGRKYKGDK